jgi:hypothetical protein
MSSLRSIVRIGLLLSVGVMGVAALGADAASAANLYVATGGTDTPNCQNAAAPCKTIKYAIGQAEGTVEADTINVGAGTYAETIPLNKSGDTGMTIVGAGSDASKGTTIAGTASVEPLVLIDPLGGGATLNHLRLTTSLTNSANAISATASLSAIDVAIEMGDGSSTNQAVKMESGLLDHVSVSGVWSGEALEDRGSVTIRDSSFVTGAAATAPTAFIVGLLGSNTAIIQRSVFKQANHSGTMPPYGLFVTQTNLALDSSMALGGQSALDIYDTQSFNTTVDGSTLDAAQPGISDPPPDQAVHLEAGESTTVATVAVEASILAENQFSSIFTAAQATITCSNSDTPNQTQVAKGSEGTINCANGVAGNVTTSPFSALFADPSGIFSNPLADYQLSPSSTAVDSVPAGAISIPTIVPSATDLVGSARVVDGNGDCIALQDKGALELQGHACPPVVENHPAAKPVTGSITNLSISPNAFFAAPSGATISKAKKKKYGATVSYKDSQVATTTFTVLKPSSGRTQGKACKKPSKANKHGKHCTIYTAIGSFTHTDTAGANKLHFSGRLKGGKLGKGSYRLQAVAHNAAGNGKAVSKQFKIK